MIFGWSGLGFVFCFAFLFVCGLFQFILVFSFMKEIQL